MRIFFILLLSIIAVQAQVSSRIGTGTTRTMRPGAGFSQYVSPYLLEQDFEGSGYDRGQTWTVVGAGTANADFSSPALVGSQSLNLAVGASGTNTTTSPTFNMPGGGGNIWYVYFQLRVVTFPTASNYRLLEFTNVFDLALNSTSNLVIRPQVGTGVATVGKVEAGTTYHVWLQGSGTGVETALQGTARVGFSTNGIRPTSGDNYAIDTDASAGGGVSTAQIIFGTRQIGANYDIIIDKVRIDNDLIGDNPQ